MKGWMNDKPVRDSFSIHPNASHYMGRSGSHLLKMELAGAYINTPINSPRIPLLRKIPVSNSIPQDTMTGHGRKETDGAHHSYTPTSTRVRAWLGGCPCAWAGRSLEIDWYFCLCVNAAAMGWAR